MLLPIPRKSPLFITRRAQEGVCLRIYAREWKQKKKVSSRLLLFYYWGRCFVLAAARDFVVHRSGERGSSSVDDLLTISGDSCDTYLKQKNKFVSVCGKNEKNFLQFASNGYAKTRLIESRNFYTAST